MATDAIGRRLSERAPGDGLPDAAARRVFSAAGRDYCWSEVIVAARFRGEWPRPPRRASAASVDEWRRRRGLLSADDTIAWLARWGLELSDLRRHVAQEDEDEPGEGDRAAWARAVCSGELTGLARALAAAVAVTADPPAAASVLDAATLARLDADFERWRAAVEASDAVPALIDTNAADWTTVVAHALAFSELEAAREAALCIRHDGMSLAEVAELSGSELVELRGMLDELGEPVHGLVAGALAGELLGPFEDAGAYRVLCMVAKHPPRADDAAVLARARSLAVVRALDRASAARLVWHERL